MSNRRCERDLMAESLSDSPPWQVLQVEEQSDIGPLLIVWSRLHPYACRLRLSLKPGGEGGTKE